MNHVMRSIRQLLDTTCGVGIWVAIVTSTLVMPWYFGGNSPPGQRLLVPVMLVGLACGLVRIGLTPRQSFPVTPIGLPLLLGLAVLWGALQTAPLPSHYLEYLSPQAYRWRTGLPEIPSSLVDESDDSSTADRQSAVMSRRPVSLSPADTRHDLAFLIVGIGAYLLGHYTISTPKSRLLLMALLAINGGMMAMFGIVQQLTWNGRLFWRVPLPEGAVPFAGYVNRNNAAGYLNMALGASVGLFVWTLVRYRFNVVQRTAHGASRRPPHRRIGVREWLGNLDATGALALAMVVCLGAGLLCSVSRGGVVALFISAISLTFILARGPQRTTKVAVVTALCLIAAIGLASWLGQASLIGERFMSLLAADGWGQDSRILHWRDGWLTAQHFLRCGSGLGTYRFVYEPFEQRVEPQWYLHAENQYLESLVELGLCGPVLLCSAIGAAFVGMRRMLLTASDPETYGLALAGLFGLMSQAIHAFFDFGLYLPANMITMAILCGAATVVPQHDRSRSSPNLMACAASHRHKRLGIVIMTSAVLATIWATREAYHLLAISDIERYVAINSRYIENDEPRIRATIDRLSRLRDSQYDSRIDVLLADQWIQLYRHTTTNSLRAQLDSTTTPEQLWTFTEPTVLHARVSRLREAENNQLLSQLQSHVDVREYLRPALLHLFKSRDVCPIRPKTHLAIAELMPVVVKGGDDRPHIDRAVALAPLEPDILFRAGLLHLQARRTEIGVGLWQQCLDGASDYRERILEMGPQLLGPVDFFDQLFRGHPLPIIEVAADYYGGDGNDSIRLQLADLAEQNLAAHPYLPEERAYLAGRIAWLRNDLDLARQHFEQGLEANGHAATLHFELAKLLVLAGDVPAARHHIGKALQESPKSQKYLRLQREIRQLQSQRPPQK